MENGSENYRRYREDGDEQGLAEVIREYKDGLTLYLYSLVGDIHIAEELCEDTFVLLGTKKPKDRHKGSFKTWLYTIGRNRAIDFLRKKTNRNYIPLNDGDGIADERLLEDSYIKEEQKIALHRAMEQLKPEHRQVLWLMYFEGLSAKEAAAVMKRSVHAAEMLAQRAKASLKQQLETEDFIYEEL